MLSFRELSEKKTKVTINPKLDQLKEKKGCSKCEDTCGEKCKCSCHDKEMSEAKKKDPTYLETDFKKRQANNEKARKDLMKGPQMKNPHLESKWYDPMEDPDFDHDEAERTRGQSGKPAKKKTKKTTKEEMAYVSQEEVSEESNQSIAETETLLTFGQYSFEPKGELVDERTRYAKETGKDFQTGKPSEKGGTLGGDDRHSKVMRHMQKDLRKSGGLMSSRGKPIKPQGKKKDKGAKPSFKMEPTSVDKIKAKLAQKRKPKPDISSRFD